MLVSSKMSDVVLSTPPVSADLQTSQELDLHLTPSTGVVIPFTTFVENSGSFAFTSSGNGTFVMPENGSYQVTLTFSVLNSADAKTSAPAQVVAYMAVSGIVLVNTPMSFYINPGKTSTCVMTALVIGYAAGTEITANLEAAKDGTLLSLVSPDGESIPANLLVTLVA